MALHHCSRTSLLPTAAIAPCALSTNLSKPATSVITGKPKDSCNAGQRSSTNKTCCQSPDNKADSATALPCPPAPNINNVLAIKLSQKNRIVGRNFSHHIGIYKDLIHNSD